MAPSWFDWKQTHSAPRSLNAGGERRLDLSERGCAVDGGVSLAEAIQVRAIDQ